RPDPETALWAWLLFGESGIPTQRAKALLSEWTTQGVTLQSIVARLPQDASTFGLTRAEGACLQQRPDALPAVTALRWDDVRYPPGLEGLPLKLRPALLFYDGEPDLLLRPLVYLAPGELDDVASRRLHEAISLLMGEDLLLAAYEGSQQADLLVEELVYGSGEALLFARSGIGARTPSEREHALLASQQLLVVSPLPPHADARSAWERVLRAVAIAAAERVLLAGAVAQAPGEVPELGDKPALSLSPPPTGTILPPNVELAEAPVDVLPWIDRLFTIAGGELVVADAATPDAATRAANHKGGAEDDAKLGQVDLGPPPSPDEILETLSRGGAVPEALRRRLLGEDDAG
ncbi:MAG: hypothetical protein ACP5HG_14190, partial [Anaerolineae bacterium]